MTVLLINALYAAETLAAFRRHRVEQTLGARRAYHEDMVRRCVGDIEDIKRHLNADGGSVENQARAVYSRDMRTAPEIVTEWRADDRAPDVMLKMAQAIADACRPGGAQRYCRDRVGNARLGPTLCLPASAALTEDSWRQSS
jgi:hypothetical protein